MPCAEMCLIHTYVLKPSLYFYTTFGDSAYMDLISIKSSTGQAGVGLAYSTALTFIRRHTRKLFHLTTHAPGNNNYKKTALTHQEISRILVLEFWLLEMWKIFCLPQHLVSGILSRQLEKTDVFGKSKWPYHLHCTVFTERTPCQVRRCTLSSRYLCIWG